MSEQKFHPLSREQMLRHVGSMDQLAPVRRFALLEGRGKSVEAVHIETGAGLAFTTVVDRALDLADVTYKGCSLCWRSRAGIVAPTYYERKGAGWLRGFGGGMMTTCGLRNVGPGNEEGWETYGLHGEISYSPAAQVRAGGRWDGETYKIEVSGEVREAYPFGPNLKLSRTWRTQFGAAWLELEDLVTNEGFRPETHMQLYHWNFGFPLLNENSRLYLTTDRVTPRDEPAAAGLEDWSLFAPPTDDYAEQVFFHAHTGRARPTGDASALLVSDSSLSDLAVELSYSANDLPYLVQWKLCGAGDYVLGVEPGNCLVEGREWHKRQALAPLAPGETISFKLRLIIHDGEESVTRAIEKYSAKNP